MERKFIVPTLWRGNAVVDAPASRSTGAGNYYAGFHMLQLSGFREARASKTAFPSWSLGTSGNGALPEFSLQRWSVAD